jgi:hypothetical protein
VKIKRVNVEDLQYSSIDQAKTILEKKKIQTDQKPDSLGRLIQGTVNRKN